MTHYIHKQTQNELKLPKGFKYAGLHSGVKKARKDLGLIYSEIPANSAAVYTLNKVKAEPLKLTQKTLNKTNVTQAVIVNSGNANACTGKQGMMDAIQMQELTAEHLGVKKEHVAVASTGIIGLEMPMDKISSHIPKLEVKDEVTALHDFSEAILTTDTFTKVVSYEVLIDGKKVTLTGVAKGSGMIEPNMGTMLSFITTDASVDKLALNHALKKITNQTYNCITVDGDTSTNDMVLVMANGAAETEVLMESHADWNLFLDALKQLNTDLSKMIARDGEGATKLIEVKVKGARSIEDAQAVAKTIVGSSLVKTAVFGTDANWGRIIAAIGYSEADFDPEMIDLKVGDIPLLKKSEAQNFSEEEATAYLENEMVVFEINLNNGKSEARAWGCDLTYDYVRINASYRS